MPVAANVAAWRGSNSSSLLLSPSSPSPFLLAWRTSPSLSSFLSHEAQNLCYTRSPFPLTDKTGPLVGTYAPPDSQRQRQPSMPGTHLLPPNLLKLFAPRPPLTYARPLDKDIDRVVKKPVSPVGPLLVMLRESAALAEGEGMEEGEEPAFTHAEQTKRQIRKEERKKRRTEEFKIAKESCTCTPFFSSLPVACVWQVARADPRRVCLLGPQINPQRMPKRSETRTRRCSSPVWCVHSALLLPVPH